MMSWKRQSIRCDPDLVSIMVEAMETFDETCGAAQQLTGGGDGLCRAPAALSCEAPDWRALHEAERVRADVAETSMRDLRCAKNSARADALQFQLEEAHWKAQQGQALAKALERERDALKLENAEQQSELSEAARDACHAREGLASGRRARSYKKEGTGNKRGQQPGKSGHGRTPRPKLEEKHERHDPPASQRTCPCCGEPLCGQRQPRDLDHGGPCQGSCPAD